MAIDNKNTDHAVDLRTAVEEKVAVQASANGTLDVLDVKQLYHELQIHQVELEMQNTELIRTKLDLEATRDSYFSLYDLAPVGYLTLNKDGLIQRANLTAATMLGLKTDDLINRPIQKFIFRDDIDSYYLQSRSAVEASEDFKLELRFVQSDGSPFWVSLQASLQDDDELWLAFSDISDRKQLEQSLRQANDTLEVQVTKRTEDLATAVTRLLLEVTERKQTEIMLRNESERIISIIETVGDPIFLKDNDHRIILANHAFYDIFALDENAVIGKTLVENVPANERQLFLEVDRRVLDSGIPDLREETLTVRDFTRTIVTRKSRFIDNFGERFLVGSIHDITERKQAKMALQKANYELEQRVTERTMELSATIDRLQSEICERELAEKKLREETAVSLQTTEALREKERMLIQQSRQAAMGEMIGNIAHQWRQPLNTLGLYTQGLGLFYGMPDFNKEFLDDSIAKSMEIIQHMSKTIDDFRDYFKPEKEKTDFYVIEAIKISLSLLEGNFNNPKITIDLVEHDNPVINGYQNEFAQVFLNILNNARDAIVEREIDDGRIIITICSENNCVVVTVTDNAGGIPDEVINKVFDPYFTTKGPQLGTGIGLFMSKTIVEKNMGGRLTVRNTDTGAEFRIEVVHGTQI